MKTTTKKISHLSEQRITYMGIAGEYAAAKGLCCTCDPFPRRGGDGHRGDLVKGGVSVSLKTRHSHLSPDFVCPPGQVVRHLNDDYGVVGLWEREYDLLDLVGYFTKDDWETHATYIPPSRGSDELRWGLDCSFLRPMDELIRLLNDIHEDVPSLATYRHIADQRYGDRSGGDTIQ